jgi:hypothetical protein
MFVVGGIVAEPTEKLQSALEHIVREEVPMDEAQQLRAEITLKINQRFQIGQAVYRINTIMENSVITRCVLGGI